MLKEIPQKTRGTVRNVGNITCLRQAKSGWNLIRAYDNTATSVILSQVKRTVLRCRQPDFTIPFVNWLNFVLKPVVVIALLISFFYYGQWRSSDFCERSIESLRGEATHVAHQDDADQIIYSLIWTVTHYANFQWRKCQLCQRDRWEEKNPKKPNPKPQKKKRVWTAASVLYNMSSQNFFNKQVCLSKCMHAFSPPPLFYHISQTQTQAS